ncbi:MAG: RNA methyltransferase [Flavobacteriales bacterium]|nr:RNA methyltransferase [Flavobacteriales bacterium]
MKSNTLNNDFLMIAKTMHGLEDVLIEELKVIGAKNIKKGKRAIEFYGNQTILYKSNVCLRTALRILKPISTFNIKNQLDLYNEVKKIKWEKIISINDTFLINSTVNNSNLFNHSQYVSQKIKDAIVDQFREKYGRRPSINKFTPTIQINAYLSGNKCQISLDSSGNSLHKRGYRVQKGNAPINEVLAAGIILLSDWDQKLIFRDPMCGSGTIIIEANMIYNNIAPNIKREKFGFMNWNDFDNDLLNNIKFNLKQEEKNITQIIEGFDNHFGAISSSRTNIRKAQINNDIKLKRFNFFKQKNLVEKRHVVFNPPYGERLKIFDEKFYEDMGNILKKFYSDSNIWIITSDLENIKKIGLKSSKKIQLFNGSLECYLFKYEIYEGSKKKDKKI